MSSRDIWSHAGGLQVRDLLASLLAVRLLDPRPGGPLYVYSPYLTDFPLFDNTFGQFSGLFRYCVELVDKPEILFSDTLIELARSSSVRIATVSGEHQYAFLRKVVRRENTGIAGRLAPDLYHEKGLLCSTFYIEGSMNFTYNGVYRRDEKITVHSTDTPEGKQKVFAALLEFDRLWKTRKSFEVGSAPE